MRRGEDREEDSIANEELVSVELTHQPPKSFVPTSASSKRSAYTQGTQLAFPVNGSTCCVVMCASPGRSASMPRYQRRANSGRNRLQRTTDIPPPKSSSTGCAPGKQVRLKCKYKWRHTYGRMEIQVKSSLVVPRARVGDDATR